MEAKLNKTLYTFFGPVIHVILRVGMVTVVKDTISQLLIRVT